MPSGRLPHPPVTYRSVFDEQREQISRFSLCLFINDPDYDAFSRLPIENYNSDWGCNDKRDYREVLFPIDENEHWWV